MHLCNKDVSGFMSVGKSQESRDSKNSYNNPGFWNAIDSLIQQSQVIIDRPKGTRHPRYQTILYPLDYGYLADTAAMDGHGIDIWRGTIVPAGVVAVICTVDLLKKDSEMKILLGCTPEEAAIVYRFHNNSDFMKGILIIRPGEA